MDFRDWILIGDFSCLDMCGFNDILEGSWELWGINSLMFVDLIPCILRVS